jgi:hypothetical protein
MTQRATGWALLILLSLALAACGSAGGAAPTLIVLPTATEGAPLASPEPSATSTPVPEVVYDFLAAACEAKWTNNGQNLDCPGEQWHTIGPGYVGVIEDAVVEGNQQMDEPVLLTHPSNNQSYYGIFGAYPPITIQEGDEFRATVGCLYGVEAESCDADFALEYYTADGEYVTAGLHWHVVYDGQLTDISADLSFLAGQTVQLILVVRDNGEPFGDYAVWVFPALWRQGQ